MRFGGHQTFYLREGWLYKGLNLLMTKPEMFEEELVFDHLGVGRNMALSIVYWLEATGLAAKKPREDRLTLGRFWLEQSGHRSQRRASSAPTLKGVHPFSR